MRLITSVVSFCFFSFLLFFYPVVEAASFKLYGKTLENGKKIDIKQLYNGFGCRGSNFSPQLSWSGEPVGTKSFALTVYDPDAPTGSGWWHWVVVDIPVSVHSLAEAASSNKKMPLGAREIRNDYGFSKFGGMCPPVGERHNYVFTLWALKVRSLDLESNATAAMAGFMIMKNSLGKAEMIPYYQRTK